MKYRKFNLWCWLFGHRWAFPFETVDYVNMANGFPSGLRRTHKRYVRKKITKRWHKCERCGKIVKIK